MIGKLKGILAEKSPGEVLVDVGGVGYQLHVSLTTFCALPEVGEPVGLVVVTNLRENSLELFGFAGSSERRLFNLLRGVSGIGPRLALSILSGIDSDELIAVLRTGDVDRLVAVPGVGRKTAERVLVELKGRVEDFGGGGAPAQAGTSIENDAVLALVALGYRQVDARKAVTASRDAPNPSIQFLIKRSLARLS